MAEVRGIGQRRNDGIRKLPASGYNVIVVVQKKKILWIDSHLAPIPAARRRQLTETSQMPSLKAIIPGLARVAILPACLLLAVVASAPCRSAIAQQSFSDIHGDPLVDVTGSKADDIDAADEPEDQSEDETGSESEDEPDDEPQYAAPVSPAAHGPSGVSHFVAQGSSQLRDVKTGLLWTQTDNGTGVSFSGAQKVCAGRGAGWRLPSVDELTQIFDESISSQCGKSACKVSSLFHLGDCCMWTGTPNGTGNVWYVALPTGDRFPSSVSSHRRALCVRAPERRAG